jgi:hypothetical protein
VWFFLAYVPECFQPVAPCRHLPLTHQADCSGERVRTVRESPKVNATEVAAAAEFFGGASDLHVSSTGTSLAKADGNPQCLAGQHLMFADSSPISIASLQIHQPRSIG